MKVIFVTKGGYYPSGGAQKSSGLWYDQIRKLVDCHLLTDQSEVPTRKGFATPSISGPIDYLSSYLLLSKKLAHCAQELKPDIIHIQSYTGYVVMPPKNIPAVVTLHDEPGFRAHDWVSSLPARVYSRMLSVSESFFRNLMVSRKPFFHAISESIRNQLVERRVPSSRICVIPNGFPDPPANTVEPRREDLMARLGLQEDSRIVLTIGNVSFRKGTHKTLFVAKKIQKTHPDVHFLIAGSKSSPLERAYASKLQYWSEKYSISNFHLLGFIQNELLDSLLRHADVYLSSSLSEACNLALMEAAVYGRPIVTTDAGAGRDLFENQGKVIPRNSSIQMMSHAVVEMLGANRNITYSGIDSYSWPRVAKRVVEFYENVVECKGRS
ncbi:MAG: glycosyltransferase family 4 protein [Candidatus Thorarchaeota archaeon]